MKILLPFFLLITMIQPLQAQKSLKQAASDACECLKTNGIGTDLEQDELLVSTCLEEALLKNLEKISQEYEIDFDDEEAGYKLGIELGKLMIVDCEEFVDYSIRMAQAEDKRESAAEEKNASIESKNTGSTSGKFERVEEKGYAYLKILTAEGRMQSFLWLRYFQGSDALIEDPKALKGKKVTIHWREIEVYRPDLKEYFKQKEITLLEVE